MHVVYFPIYVLWIYWSVRARSLMFFSAANPGMKNGGFIMESKFGIYKSIPQQYYPQTALISSASDISEIDGILKAHKIDYPLFAKPDIGLRGSAVKKIS